MNKHTPGPWRIIPRSNKRNGPYVVRGRQGGFMVMGLSPEAEDADACLIAAAPDLLNALIDAREQLEIYEAERTGENYNDPKINAAIDRATGAKS